MTKSFDVFSVREYFPSIENPSSSSWVLNQAKEIQKCGINLLVISPTPKVPWVIKKIMFRKHAWKIRPSLSVQDYLGVNVVRPPYIKLPGKYFLDYNLSNASKSIFRVSKEFDAKLIHAHFGHAGVAALKLKYVQKLPLITSFYGFDLGSDKHRLQKYYSELAKEGSLFLVLSSDMKNDLIEIGFPDEKIMIHHLGVDLDTFIPPIEKNIPKSNFVFTIVASFTERKGIHISIEAFKKFVKKHSILNCQLRIIGDGPYINYLKHQAKNNKDIIFINNFQAHNPRALVLQEMQNCDVFILTSITLPDADKEGTPIVLMEAQACGKPCISSFHAGIPEVVIHNQTGILLTEGDTGGISEAMFQLFSDREKRLLLSKNARIHIKNNFNNKIQISKLLDIYKPFLT